MKIQNRKRILMLLENCPYPQDIRVRNESISLTKSGYQVVVVCPMKKRQKWQETINDVRVYRYPAPPSADGFLGYIVEYSYSLIAAFLFSLIVFLRHGFDIIHAHNPPDIFVLVAVCYKILGKQFVFDQHDLSPEMYYARFSGQGSTLVYKSLLMFERLSCRIADHVITTNQSYKKQIIQRNKLHESSVTIVRNGPILEELPTLNDVSREKNGKAALCYVGDMGFHDGVDYLLRSLYCILNKYNRDDFFCTLVGDGDALESLQILAEELQITDHLIFTGWIEYDEVPLYLNQSDICVAPEPSNSYNDRSTMIKILEYMAFSKPIIAFDLPEHRFSAGDAAVYAESNNELEFAAQIVQLMDDHEKQKQLGKIGRERIKANLAWCHQKDYLINVYKQL